MEKIKIKIGEIEVEYEGNEDFIKNNLLTYIEAVADLASSKKIIALGSESSSSGAHKSGGPRGMTTSTFSTKLQSKSGPDLIIAAAAKLTFTDGLESFERQQLLNEMKTASGYYKSSYRSNLGNYIQTLVKADRLRSVGENRFSLSVQEKDKLATISD